MNITENRRKRLKEWFAGKTLPQSEKSYLSQLMTGRTSFGERAARRLERDYGMPEGYLDGIPHIGTIPPDSYEKLTIQQREFLSILDTFPNQEVNRLLEELREKKAFYESLIEELLAKRREK